MTVYTFDADDNDYVVLWSESRGFDGAVRDSEQMNDMRARLPALDDREQNILVEVRTEYSAPIRIGPGIFEVLDLQDLIHQSFTVTRPRKEFLCWDADPIDPTNTVICNIDNLSPPAS